MFFEYLKNIDGYFVNLNSIINVVTVLNKWFLYFV